MSGQKLAESKLWWKGPQFFEKPRDQWPPQPDVVETRESREGYRKEETRRIEKWFLCSAVTENLRNKRTGWKEEFWLKVTERWSDLYKGFRVASVIFLWLGRFSRYNYRSTSQMAISGIQRSVLKAIQAKELSKLRRALEQGKKPDREYESLRPYLDAEGMIRIGGRLKQVPRLPLSVRCPLLLDGKQEYALKILKYIHEKELKHCGGKRTLMAEVRYSIWVTGLAKLAEKVLKHCVWCNRSSKKQPIKIGKAPLHFTRVPLSNGCAFSEIGLDMAGPFSVKQGRGRAIAKRYALLFSCCWTRALNVEVADSASTESCVMAFIRHCNVYGFPRYVNSDRGGNLVGTERHLREQWEVLETAMKSKAVDWPNISWHFNPPYSPRFTGHVEVMVKILKGCLRRILGQPRYLFREEELLTLMKVAQGYANMRPLTAPSDHPDDPPPLTPADFLMTGNRFLGSVPEYDWENYDLKTRKEMLGQVTGELWKALRKDYITTLQEYSKTRGEKSMKVGDVVLILDKTLPTGRYALGRIVSARTNPDGKARSFDIKHRGEIIQRSIMTLAPLELS